jgi:hypothetical protein
MISRKAKEGREVLSESGRELLDKGRDLYEKGPSGVTKPRSCPSAAGARSKAVF